MTRAPWRKDISAANRISLFLFVGAALVLSCAGVASAIPQGSTTSEEFQRSTAPQGVFGGRLVLALRSEPKTFNPVLAVDGSSKEILGLMTADLIHINRLSQGTEPALAKSWKVSPDGLRYVLQLRRGLRFSDGHPFDADNVVFSFQVYLDEKVHSPQRDLLTVGDKPIAVRKLAQDRVEFSMSEPYAAAERLFDSVAILPRHLLQSAYEAGKLGDAWGTTVRPDQIAGLGPFRLKEYVPGQRVVLERNPYYWKTDPQGRRLPYLDEVAYLFVASEDAEVLRFQSGETDVLSRFSAQNYALLDAKKDSSGYRVFDLGPGLEYNFLFFNLNDASADQPADIARKKAWFSDVRFRQAVSDALDRDAIVRIVFRRRATAIWGNVTPGNKRWMDQNLPHPARSVEQSRQLLAAAGFSWKSDGTLVDHSDQPVEFSILTSSSNAQRLQMATMIQQDLSQLGMHVDVVSMEFRSMLDRIFNSFNYEASLLSLGTGDTDPTAEMNVWTSSGSTHVWNLGESKPATPWEMEIDALMQKQEVSLKYAERKRIYDQVQELVAQNLPVICLVSPNILLAARNDVREFSARDTGPLRGLECGGIVSSQELERPAKMIAPTIDAASPAAIRWTDARLVRECLEGNQEAWEALVDKYKNLIYSIPLKFQLGPDAAADIFQSVCVELLSELGSLREPKALPKWLMQVTLHNCIRWKRLESRSTRLEEDEEPPAQGEPALNAEQILREAEQEQILRDAVAALPPRCVQLVEMLFFRQPALPYAEVAGRLGIATGSIGFIRGRCLKRLRKELESRGHR